MTLSDPNATASAVATAAKLLNVPNTGKILSGAWWIGSYPSTGSVTPPIVTADFNNAFLGMYAKMGGAGSSGFPSIMGMCDFQTHRNSWQTVYPLTAIPHCLAGGLLSILWLPLPYNDSEANGGEYGTNGWPIMGAGASNGAPWNEGLTKASVAFKIDSTFAAGTGTIPATLNVSNPAFQSSGYLWVQTALGYAIVSYSGFNSTGFTGCYCPNTAAVNVRKGMAIVDYSVMIPGTPQNAALNFSLNDLDALLVMLDGYAIAPMLRILEEPNNSPGDVHFWYAGTPAGYYQALWSYHFNYITGTAAQIPVSPGLSGSLTTAAQPVVATAPLANPPTRPVHNAIWTFSQIGFGGAFDSTYAAPLPGQVDAIGLDYYASNLSNFGTSNAVWNTIRSRYGNNIIMGITEMGQLGSSPKAASSWEPAWTQFGTPPNAYGPSFFMSWSDGADMSPNLAYSFALQSGASAIWNGPLVKNLKPGAWSLAPQGAGMLLMNP